MAEGAQVSGTLSPYKYVEAGQKAQVTAIGNSVSSSFSQVAIINTLINVFLGGALNMMWDLVNTLQILNYMPLIQVYYPEFLKLSLSFLKMAQADINVPYSEKIIGVLVNFTNIEDKPLNT